MGVDVEDIVLNSLTEGSTAVAGAVSSSDADNAA